MKMIKDFIGDFISYFFFIIFMIIVYAIFNVAPNLIAISAVIAIGLVVLERIICLIVKKIAKK